MRYIRNFLLVLLLVIVIPVSSDYETQPLINTQPMPNVIFMIGDGMGPDQLRAASMVEYGIENGSIMDTWNVQSLYTTDSADGKLTDSAAAGTALASGQITKNGRIGMDTDGVFRIKNLREYLGVDFGYASGIVTTTEVSHATPAVFSAHVNDRDSKKSILAQQLNSDLSVLLGGGLSMPYIGGVDGAKKLGADAGFDVATNVAELKSLQSTSNRLFGPFFQYSIPFELERNPEVSPSIIEMSQAALDVLTRQNKPFFLEIEGGRIDHAGHEADYGATNKTVRGIMETIMFEKTVRLMQQFAENDGNTIIIVSADHETGDFQYNGFTENGILPSINNTESENNVIRVNRINNLQSTWAGSSHTRTPVRFLGYGFSTTYNVDKIQDVFWAVNKELGSFPVINKLDVSISNGTLTVSTDFRDLDSSADKATITVTDTVTGIVDEISVDLSYTDTGSFTRNIALDGNNSISVKIKIHDTSTGTDISTTSLQEIVQSKSEELVSNQDKGILSLVLFFPAIAVLIYRKKPTQIFQA